MIKSYGHIWLLKNVWKSSSENRVISCLNLESHFLFTNLESQLQCSDELAFTVLQNLLFHLFVLITLNMPCIHIKY